MSLQWTLVAVFLYAEIAVIALLMLPFISVTVWQKLFKSRFLKRLGAYSNFYFLAFIFILLLLFLDSLRQMNKYSVHDTEYEHGHNHLDAELQRSMKMFRAQRNCYISGFALFLAPVIYRLASLISKQATLTASAEASIKQAASASDMARKLLKEKEKWEKGETTVEGNEGTSTQSETENKIKDLKNQLQSTVKELEATKLNLETLKIQAEGTNREYDRLLAEHDKLMQTVSKASGDVEDKKDE